MAANDLTPKQEAFVLAYLETGSASEAYRRAYDAKNMAANVIHVKASELLKNGKVRVRIEDIQFSKRKQHDVTVERILSELAKIGFANIYDYIRTTGDGNAYVDLTALTREQAAAIQEIVVEEYTEGKGEQKRDVRKTKFKLLDKRAALVDMGKHIGMFIERKEVGAPGEFSKMEDGDLDSMIAAEAAALAKGVRRTSH